MSLLLLKNMLRALAATSIELGSAFYQQHGDLAILITHANFPALPPLRNDFAHLIPHSHIPKLHPLPFASPKYTPETSVTHINGTSFSLIDEQCSWVGFEEELQKYRKEEERKRRQAEIEAYTRLLDELEQPEQVVTVGEMLYTNYPVQASRIELAIESFHQTIAE